MKKIILSTFLIMGSLVANNAFDISKARDNAISYEAKSKYVYNVNTNNEVKGHEAVRVKIGKIKRVSKNRLKKIIQKSTKTKIRGETIDIDSEVIITFDNSYNIISFIGPDSTGRILEPVAYNRVKGSKKTKEKGSLKKIGYKKFAGKFEGDNFDIVDIYYSLEKGKGKTANFKKTIFTKVNMPLDQYYQTVEVCVMNINHDGHINYITYSHKNDDGGYSVYKTIKIKTK